MTDQSGPPDPLTALAAGAAQVHELFTAYVTAGFTRAEALQLVAIPLSAATQAGLNGMEKPPGD